MSGSSAVNGSRKITIPALLSLTGVFSYTMFRLFKYGVVFLCGEVIESLLNRLEHEEVDEYDKQRLEGKRFRLLWWVYHLTAHEN
jgi:predicted DNA repair protein MutK